MYMYSHVESSKYRGLELKFESWDLPGRWH